MSKNIISVQGLSKTFKQYKKSAGLKQSIRDLFKRQYFNIDAVKNVNLEIGEGEFVGFIGPNGAGKTTTLKMLAGLLFPSAGEIEVLGHKPYKREAKFLRNYALVMGQKSQLMPDLPPIETFELNKEIYEIDEKEYKKP